MTQAEKLEALVRKATGCGWKPPLDIGSTEDQIRYVIKLRGSTKIRGMLLSHDFARALFGSNIVRHIEVDDDGNTWHFSTLAYQYHLQRAVISKDPIDYMYKAVFGEKV